jgi:hypothetical protein
MMMRSSGFAMRDMVVVLAILLGLAILATLMVPAISYCPELANQAECRSNLKRIGMALDMYKGESNGRFPLLWTTGQPEADVSRSDSAGTIEELRTKLVGREAAMQNVWLLIDEGLVTEGIFQCPSDSDYIPRDFTGLSDRSTKVGWRSSRNFSYGMHFPYESTAVDGRAIENPAHLNAQKRGSFVIMADKNPSQNNEPAAPVGPDKSPSNHHEDGEAYLMYNGAVNWKKSINDSDVNGDDIYTIETDLPPGQSNKNSETPANLDDQYIVRHPALTKR